MQIPAKIVVRMEQKHPPLEPLIEAVAAQRKIRRRIRRAAGQFSPEIDNNRTLECRIDEQRRGERDLQIRIVIERIDICSEVQRNILVCQPAGDAVRDGRVSAIVENEPGAGAFRRKRDG